jgi:hypothetical protein
MQTSLQHKPHSEEKGIEMTHKQAVQDARKRAHRYQFEDGLMEMAQGGAFALMGLALWWIDSLAILSSANKGLFALGFLAFAAVLGVVVVSLIVRYKKRLVFPRTGTVATDEEDHKAAARSGLIVILLSLAIAAAAIWLDGWFVNTTTIVGATLTLILQATAARTGILRMQVVALLPLAISILMAYFQVEEPSASAFVLGGSGLAGLLAGMLALRSYLANNPAIVDEGN